MKRLFTLFLLFFIIQKIVSQDFSINFRPISSNKALSQNTVNCIIQDKYGFLWIGTQDGLNRYDAYDFKVFVHDPTDPQSISDSYIRSICEDSKENIWIGTERGLNRYDFLSETFIKYPDHNDEAKESINNSINVITESKSSPGMLWLGKNNGIFSVDVETGEYTKYTIPVSERDNKVDYPVNTIHESSSTPGIIWIGTTNGLFRFNYLDGTFSRFTKNNGLSSNVLSYIFEDRDNNMWLGTDNGLNLFNRKTGEIIIHKNETGNQYSLSNNNITTIFEDSFDNLWIGTIGGGLNLYNEEKNQFFNWMPQAGSQFSISNSNITAIYQDISGVLWVANQANGIDRIIFNNEKFAHYFHQPGNPNTISGNSVRAILVDDKDQLWVGSSNGISVYNNTSGRYNHFEHDPNNSNSLSSNLIRVIRQDRNGIFWIGTRDGGLNRYNPLDNTFKKFINDINNPSSISSNYIRDIYEDREGQIWIATVSGGLNKLNPSTEIFTHYRYDETNSQSINDDRVYSICEDAKGIFWIGTARGIAKFNPQEGSFKRFLARPFEPDSLSYHYILGISEDHSGNIWIATYGGGINKYDPETEKFTHYTKEDGLPNKAVYGIIEDNNYKLWMSTNHGIAKFDPDNEGFTNFTIADGLQENEFNSGAYYKHPDGELYFGGVNGISRFKPESIKPNSFSPPVVIYEFQLFNQTVMPNDTVNGKRILTKSILETDTIRLSFRESVFSLSFAALDFSFPENNNYKYILDGFDSDWNDVGVRRYVTYTSLPAGEYTFHVIGSSSSGIWNDVGRSIHIIIVPPWWKTSMFFMLLSIAFASLILLYIRTRLSNLKKEKLTLERLIREGTVEIREKNEILREKQLELKASNATKDKFFSIIAHDLLNPFSNILGLTELLKSDYKNMEAAELEYVIKQLYKSSNLTYRLLDNLLTWSRSQLGKIRINKEKYNLKQLVDDSYVSSIPNADKKRIKIINKIPEDTEIITDKTTMSIVLNNLINNAIKFTKEGGSIQISAELFDKNVRLIIQDNGIGISEESISKLFQIDESQTTIGTNNEKGTGLGLILCKEFVEKNSGSIYVESEVNIGSSFIITLPH